MSRGYRSGSAWVTTQAGPAAPHELPHARVTGMRVKLGCRHLRFSSPLCAKWDSAAVVHAAKMGGPRMSILVLLLVLLAFLALSRLMSGGRPSRDVDRLGPLSERWLAEHRSSRQP